MKREEAIRRMECCRNFLANNYSDMGEPNFTAFNMAIKALEQEPCDDAISRQAVIDEMCKRYSVGDMITLGFIQKLPSVNPQESCDTCEHSDEIDGNNCYECVKGMRNNYNLKKQEPCDDCCNGNQIEKAKLCQKSYIAGMEHKQEPKAGHWIDGHCDCCGKDMAFHIGRCGGNAYTEMFYSDFCPNCGAKMVEPQESSDDYEIIVPKGIWNAKFKAESKKIGNEEEIYCTECPYFTDVIYKDERWYGARCKKDGHSTMPSMYAIKSLHNSCPLKAESEVKK